MKRIYADFDPAFGVIVAATNDSNFHKLRHETSFVNSINMNEVNVQFVKICAICGQKSFAVGEAKSA